MAPAKEEAHKVPTDAAHMSELVSPTDRPLTRILSGTKPIHREHSFYQIAWFSSTPWWWNPEFTMVIKKCKINRQFKGKVKVLFRLPEKPMFGDDSKHLSEDLFQEPFFTQTSLETSVVSSQPIEGFEPETMMEWSAEEQTLAFFKVPVTDEYDVPQADPSKQVSSYIGGGFIFELWEDGLIWDKKVAVGGLTLRDLREENGLDPNKFDTEVIKMYMCGEGVGSGGDLDEAVLGGAEFAAVEVELGMSGMARGMVGKKHVPRAESTGGLYNIVKLNLPPHTAIKMAPGNVRGMSYGVHMAHSYSVGDTGRKRLLMATAAEEGVIQIGSSVPGKVLGEILDPDDEDEGPDGHRWILSKDAWVAHTGAVRIRKVLATPDMEGDEWTKGLEMAEGKGVLVYAGSGQTIRQELAAKEEFLVEGSSLLAWQWRCKFRWVNISPASLGIGQTWYALFKGPGTVVYATRRKYDCQPDLTKAIDRQRQAEVVSHATAKLRWKDVSRKARMSVRSGLLKKVQEPSKDEGPAPPACKEESNPSKEEGSPFKEEAKEEGDPSEKEGDPSEKEGDPSKEEGDPSKEEAT